MLDFLLSILALTTIIYLVFKIKFLRLSALTVKFELLDYTGLNDLSAKSIKQYLNDGGNLDYDECYYGCDRPE